MELKSVCEPVNIFWQCSVMDAWGIAHEERATREHMAQQWALISLHECRHSNVSMSTGGDLTPAEGRLCLHHRESEGPLFWVESQWIQTK